MIVSGDKGPWYAAGLSFECSGCGGCCAGPAEGYVWVTKADIAAIAEFLKIPEDLMRRDHVRRVGIRHSLRERADNNDCVFLETGPAGRSCRIYPVRPVQCRTWPFWASNLSHPDAWAEAGQRCRGINRGQNHSADEIQARRDATRE
ncbi:MAG: YkgJ family cysteine cluster protein [Phycisphaerae bacterium]|jgi:hypothetical protein